jgi:hypothetical protein
MDNFLFSNNQSLNFKVHVLSNEIILLLDNTTDQLREDHRRLEAEMNEMKEMMKTMKTNMIHVTSDTLTTNRGNKYIQHMTSDILKTNRGNKYTQHVTSDTLTTNRGNKYTQHVTSDTLTTNRGSKYTQHGTMIHAQRKEVTKIYNT